MIWLKLKKKTFQNATPPWPFHHFTWKFAQRYFSKLQKTWLERIFEFLLFIARQNLKKLRKSPMSQIFCLINSTKMKNSKIQSGQGFWTIERYLRANFQVKWSSGKWVVAFWRSSFSISWSKHCIFVWFLFHYLLRRLTFNIYKIWTVEN